MKLPNLVIAGAPKCGSTALYYYLDSHPDACGSDVKETHFLMDRKWLDDPANADEVRATNHFNYINDGLDTYGSYFTSCEGSGARILFEATPGYLYQKTALDVLPQLDAKLIFILRKPSQRMWSLYKYATGNLATLPKDMTFSEFIEWLKMPRAKDQVVSIDEDEYHYSKYVEYLLPFKERCKSGQVLVYLAENLRKDPVNFMKQLSTDIGIDPSFYDNYEFVAHNESFRAKNQMLQKIRRKLSHTLPNADFRQSRAFKSLIHLYEKFNGDKPLEMTEADNACLKQLEEEYRPYSERLAQEFNLDLSPWGIQQPAMAEKVA